MAGWRDLTLPAIAAITGGPASAETSPDDDLRRLLKVSEMDLRPVLLYFHYPHEEGEKASAEGKLSKKQCDQLVGEEVSRWALLYRCYEVDMGKSDRKVAERLGAGPGTSYAVVNGKLEVVARSGPIANDKAIAKFLGDTLRDGCPSLWSDLGKQLEDQKSLLAEARKLAAKKDWKAAQEKYDLIVRSDLRIGDWWDEAAREADRIAQKAEQSR